MQLQIFCWSKIQIEVIAKNENLMSHKKKCYKCLEVWVQCNIITALRGWKIFWGVFVICVMRCRMLLKGNSCIRRVFFYSAFSTVFSMQQPSLLLFLKAPDVLKNFNFPPFSSYDLCLVTKLLVSKFLCSHVQDMKKQFTFCFLKLWMLFLNIRWLYFYVTVS